MFVSADYLSVQYGIDDDIAKFFVDRDPPKDNLYWHEKLLYLRPSPGYLFIPLMFDLLYRIGISKQQLLGNEFVQTMEKIGHISALEEVKKITAIEAIGQCEALVFRTKKNKYWHKCIAAYFKEEPGNLLTNFATPIKALHRGDMFLFALCNIDIIDEQVQQIAELWFALISTLLLFDDAEDLQNDLLKGEENAYIESGLNPIGLEHINALVEKNIDKLSKVNRSMAHQLKSSFVQTWKLPYISQLINESKWH